MKTDLRKGASWESLVLKRKQSGDTFHSFKSDKQLTALACHYEVKIKTERSVLVGGDLGNPTATAVTKVEIL